MDHISPTLCVITDDSAVVQCVSEYAFSLGIQCAMFASAEQFLDCFNLSLPGCVVCEMDSKGMNGLELQRRMSANGSIISQIMIGENLDVPRVVSAMQKGAVAVIEKPCDKKLLANAIQKGIDISRIMRKHCGKWKILQNRVQTLDSRERKVMQLIVDSVPTKTIARKLGVCQRTAARIRADVFEKMEAESAVELAQMAAEMNLRPATRIDPLPHPIRHAHVSFDQQYSGQMEVCR